jgi:hypothetical protein
MVCEMVVDPGCQMVGQMVGQIVGERNGCWYRWSNSCL